MGYDLHITRRSSWSDDEGPEIALDEWKAYLAEDSEFDHEGFAEAQTPEGSVIRMESDGLAVWRAYSGHEPDGNKAWFAYRRGNLVVKNPDEEIRRKMYQVAVALNARVQGDEGELYDPAGEELPTETVAGSSGHDRRPWWRFWR